MSNFKISNFNVHLGNIHLLFLVVVYLKPEYKLCVAGRTPMLRKIFYYHKGTSRMTYGKTNFRPSFSDDILGDYLSRLTAADRAMVNSTCKDIDECLFDLALTSKLSYNTRIKVKHVICYVWGKKYPCIPQCVSFNKGNKLNRYPK